MRFFKFSSLLALAALASCNPDKEVSAPATSKSVFVINEGGLGKNNGSISRYDIETKAVAADVFRVANGRGLGDVVQNFVVRGSRGYAVVNGSNKVEVVSLPDFKSIATVRGLTQPRYLLPVSDTRAYITQWGNYSGTIPASVKVLNLTTNTVVDSITVGAQPERLVLAGGKVFVANYGGKTVSVIDPATNRVSSTVTVGDAPNSLAVDKNNRLWILCGGQVNYDPATRYSTVDYTTTTAGSICSLDPANPAGVTAPRVFATNRLSPNDLHINNTGDQLYFRATNAATYVGGVCRLGIAETTLPSLTAPLIPGLFYGLGIDPLSGIIYTGTGNFSADKMARYQPAGTLIDENTVGLGPNGFVFQ